jgi:hypothetical protein
MSMLNEDILFLIFEELQDDPKSLFSCLMVNKLWCETTVPILWKNPWSYTSINYRKKRNLFIIIAHYIFDNIKKFITEEESFQLPSVLDKSLLFDYLSFCKSINVDNINDIISTGSSLAYNQFIMQQEFYYLFMKKCPELKYLDMRSIRHQIFYFPESKARLESLCELKCDTSIDSSYFYGLSHFCQSIQKLTIDNTEARPNHGIVKLIEAQRNLKYFEWFDDFYDDYLIGNPYKEILLALEKKAYSLNYLRIYFKYVEGFDHILIQEILSKLYKLKILIIDDYLFFTKEQLEKLKMQVYQELEILNIEYNKLDVISSIIEKSGGSLKKVLFKPYKTIECDYDNITESSFNFIRKVYENCPSIEYLTIAFTPSKKHFIEFENLLKICQNLKSLLIALTNIDKIIIFENLLEYEELLEILIRSAPINLKEIRFGVLSGESKFSLVNLKKFLEKWRGRPALSILTSGPSYIIDDYTRLIDKYKRDGIIKDFKCEPSVNDINYNIIDHVVI